MFNLMESLYKQFPMPDASDELEEDEMGPPAPSERDPSTYSRTAEMGMGGPLGNMAQMGEALFDMGRRATSGDGAKVDEIELERRPLDYQSRAIGSEKDGWVTNLAMKMFGGGLL